MSQKGRGFDDFSDDLLREAGSLSDADLERIMAGAEPGRQGPRIEALEPGATVRGIVVDVASGEVLVELDGKTLGAIDLSEFPEGEAPRIGDSIVARFERHDPEKNTARLSVGGVRREVLWDEIHAGTVLEGTVTAVNKGGLTLEVKGVRAFLPVSQIELERVSDLAPYVGSRLRCEVTSVDRASRNLVVSRRIVLEREAQAMKGKALARLSEGEVLSGTVKRITDHGAFIDLGGVDGLLAASRIRDHLKRKNLKEPLREGQTVQVQIIHVDRERERIGLDFKVLEAEIWSRAIESYAVGDEVTGWVSRKTPEGAVLSVDEGLEALLPAHLYHKLPEEPRPGSIIKAVVDVIDTAARRMLLRPR